MKRYRVLASCLALLATTTFLQAGDANLAGQILTPEIAAHALGTEVSPAPRDTTTSSTVVSHASFTSATAPKRQISVLVRRGGSAERAKAIFESSKEAFKGEDVSGHGAAAYRTRTPAQLDLLSGRDRLFIVSTLQKPDLAAQEKAAAPILKMLPK